MLLQRHNEAVVATQSSSTASKVEATNGQTSPRNPPSPPSPLLSTEHGSEFILPAWQRSCVLVRLGEKKALAAAVAVATDAEVRE